MTLQLTNGHRRRCDRQQCPAGANIFLCNPEVLVNPVTTVNRAVGVQGRLEDVQERLDDSRERPHWGWTASYPTH